MVTITVEAAPAMCKHGPCLEAAKYGFDGWCSMHWFRRRSGVDMDLPRQRVPYSEAEDEIILAEYRQNGPWHRDWVAVARQLNRSPASVHARIRYLQQADKMRAYGREHWAKGAAERQADMAERLIPVA